LDAIEEKLDREVRESEVGSTRNVEVDSSQDEVADIIAERLLPVAEDLL
jgi:hypothetical protein